MNARIYNIYICVCVSPGDQNSISRVITMIQKMVRGTVLLNTQHYKVWIKDKVGLSREWSKIVPYTSV